MDFYDEIYYSLAGQLLPEAELRLLDRLGLDEDPDLQIILGGMEEIQRLMCREIMTLRRLDT